MSDILQWIVAIAVFCLVIGFALVPIAVQFYNRIKKR